MSVDCVGNNGPGRSVLEHPRDNLAQESWNRLRARAKPFLMSESANNVRCGLSAYKTELTACLESKSVSQEISVEVSDKPEIIDS